MDNLTATAIRQADKSGLPHNPNVIVETIRKGLPRDVEFGSAEGLGTIRKTGDVIEFLRDGNVVKTATLEQVGADRLLVNYAISQAVVAVRVGKI